MSLDPDISVTVTAAPRVNAVVKPSQHLSVSVAPAEIHVVGTAALGPRGPAGAEGYPGPPGPPGPVGARWVGTWSPNDSYLVNDAVVYNGSSYLASVAIDPGDTTPDQMPGFWLLIAQKGAKGDPGGGGGGSAPINMPADWDYGSWANLTSNGVLVDADHPYEVNIGVRTSIAELSGSTAEVFLLVSPDNSMSWVAADIIRRSRQGGPSSGAGSWVTDDVMTAVVPAGGYIMVSISLAASGGSVGPGVYNWASRRRLD